jgi:hypothetical protein
MSKWVELLIEVGVIERARATLPWFMKEAKCAHKYWRKGHSLTKHVIAADTGMSFLDPYT